MRPHSANLSARAEGSSASTCSFRFLLRPCEQQAVDRLPRDRHRLVKLVVGVLEGGHGAGDALLSVRSAPGGGSNAPAIFAAFTRAGTRSGLSSSPIARR